MAQVGVQAPANLMEMFGSASPMMWDIANQQVNDQTLGNLINRQSAQQAMDINSQKLPFELEQLGLANQTTRAQLPGVEADAGLKQNSFKRDTATNDDQIQATRAKLAKEVSDSDLAQAENAVKTAMVHPSAEVRKQAEDMYQHLYEIKKERDKLKEQSDNQLALEELRGKNQQGLMQQQIDAGRFKKLDKFGLSFSQRLANENDPVKKLTMLNIAAQEAEQAGNGDLADGYRELGRSIEQLAKEKLAAQKPNQPDLTQLGGIPTTQQSPLVAPKQNNTKPKMAQQDYQQWFTNAKKLNPGLSDQEIEQEAIKRGYR